MVTEVAVATFTGNVAVVAPAGTVTLAGTKAEPAGSTAKDTLAPLLGAGLFSVTVPSTERPSGTLAELRLIEDKSNGESCAETELTKLKLASSTRMMVPITRIRCFDLTASGPLASM